MYEWLKIINDDHADRVRLTEAWKWLLIALSRSNPNTTFFEELTKQERVVKDKISERGYDVDSTRKEAEAQAAAGNRAIPHIPAVRNYEPACRHLGDESRERG